MNQSWQPGDTMTLSANATAFYTRLVLHVREKASRAGKLSSPARTRPPTGSHAKTDGEPVRSLRKYRL